MKIEKLTDNKIRIIFNVDDLAQKNIDVHSLIKNTDRTQTFFKKILKQAQKEVGFDIQNSKLLIEAFISSDGFFVLTFTKIESDYKQKKSSIPKPKRKISSTSSSIAIYNFNNFEEFCNFCTYINHSKLKNTKNLAKKISLYEYNSKYFLILSDIDTNCTYLSLFYTLISEFAKLVSNSQCFASKIIEYGNIVFKNNAIQNGIKFFCKA